MASGLSARPQQSAGVRDGAFCADATVASRLALTRGERVVRIRRVRLADGIPLSFELSLFLLQRLKLKIIPLILLGIGFGLIWNFLGR